MLIKQTKNKVIANATITENKRFLKWLINQTLNKKCKNRLACNFYLRTYLYEFPKIRVTDSCLIKIFKKFKYPLILYDT